MMLAPAMCALAAAIVAPSAHVDAVQAVSATTVRVTGEVSEDTWRAA